MNFDDLENRFTYHAPKEDQAGRYTSIRVEAREFARLLNDLVPDCVLG